MSQELIYTLISLPISLVTIVATFIYYSKHAPQMKSPFLKGMIVGFVIMGIIAICAVFIHIYLGLVVAAISFPWLGVYLWFGTERVRQDYRDYNKKLEDKWKK